MHGPELSTVGGLIPDRGASPEVAAALASVEWGSTELGEPAEWPPALRNIVDVVLGSRFSMWMGWGPELRFFYNDAYGRDTLGVKHPWALGKRASEVWAEIWDDIGPRLDHVLRTGDATWDEDLLLFLERSGFREETYHTFSYSPLVDDADVVGVLCVVSEETERVIGTRRLGTLRRLASDIAGATGAEQAAAVLDVVLAENRADLPFALTYLYGPEDPTVAELLSAGGHEPDGAFAPGRLNEDGLWPIGRAASGLVVVDVDDVAGGMELPTGDWDVPPRQVALAPISEPGSDRPAGVLVAGLNPLRPFDGPYRDWVQLVAGQIAAAVSNLRAFEAERRRAEALAELDRAKTAFFTNISHEFRTPLTLLLGPLEELASTHRDQLAPDVGDRLELAHRNALRLLKLVNALLDFARLESGRLEPDLRPTDLAARTTEIAGMFRSAIEAGGLDLRVDCTAIEGEVLVDVDMWELILTNLLSNAFKHTMDGEIAVTLRATGDRVLLDVEDTGVGIPAEEIPQLFGRFHRVVGAASRSHEGSGIGLSLVRELIDLHDGDVTVTSRPGIGTTFTVSMPLLRPDPRSPAPVPPGTRRSRSVDAHLAEVRQWAVGHEPPVPGAPATTPGDRRRVLVVDDNADMRSYVTRLLGERYEVTTAVDGAEALASIERDRPDLVLSDVMMPGIDGLELVRRVRAMPDGRDLPMILLTARAGPESSGEGLDVGADDYLVKPFSADDLVARVSARLDTASERRRTSALQELAVALRDVTAEDDVVSAVQVCTRSLLGADRVAIAVVDGDMLRCHLPDSAPVEIAQRYHLIDRHSAAPLAVSARDATTIAVGSAGELARSFPESAEDHETAGAAATVVVPLLRAGADPLGAISVSWSGDHAVDEAVQARVRSVAAVVAGSIEQLRIRRRERQIAEEIQGRLLDVDIGSSVGVVTARYEPADESMVVGGDWYDAVALGPGRLGLAVGDSVGHGLPAALVMGQLRSALGAAAVAFDDPADVIDMVDAFAERLDGADCTTALYGVVEGTSEGSRLTWSCAGHLPPLVCTDGRADVLWGGRRKPLGIGGTRGATERRDLPPASLVLLYTDGLVEQPGEPLDASIEELRRSLESIDHLTAAELCEALLTRTRPGAGTDDDVALVALRTTGRTPTRFVDAFTAEAASVPDARQRLRDWIDGLDGNVPDVDDVLLAVGEAVANAAEHGSSYEAGRVVGVEAVRTASGLRVAVTDSGRWERDAAHSTQLGRGRGMRIMERLADELSVTRSRLGTAVVMAFAAPPGA
ncbi:SpoIIE family protein phosphatase [Dermatobacter hominis]|uniref:SpoIIE family protein phosphatase n=1 Tax=Dermatobacter hominis TaxID=2884263 RepID=UPI001D103410|nr:SpoIIE family protein phosphatase [Dermatobacter hominis]UDY37541.1 SpoIIE family protein phosphatase [Dermatobacter hominis]